MHTVSQSVTISVLVFTVISTVVVEVSCFVNADTLAPVAGDLPHNHLYERARKLA